VPPSAPALSRLACRRPPAECVNTFDAHDDKVWALALGGRSGAVFASGGGDGAVALWEDCTSADADEEAAAAEAAVLKEQELANALRVRRRVRSMQGTGSALGGLSGAVRPVELLLAGLCARVPLTACSFRAARGGLFLLAWRYRCQGGCLASSTMSNPPAGRGLWRGRPPGL
jgi:hypothetical protein